MPPRSFTHAPVPGRSRCFPDCLQERPDAHKSPLLSPSGASTALILHPHFIIPSLVFVTAQTLLQIRVCPTEGWGQKDGGGSWHRLAERHGHEPNTWHCCPESLGTGDLTQPYNFPFVGEGWNSCFNGSWCYIHEKLLLDAQIEFGHG